MITSITERAQYVARMRTNFALEGLHADATDLALQDAYIAGEVKLSVLLFYAQAFASACASDPLECSCQLGAIWDSSDAHGQGASRS